MEGVGSKIVEFSWATVFEWFWQVVAIILLVWILKKLMFKPVTEFMDKRKQMIADEVKNANDAKTDAHKLKSEYDGKIKHINDEADKILKDARRKALDREAQIIDGAKEEATAIKTKAQADTKLELEKVRSEMKDEMISVASLMASKFVQSELTKEKQEQLIKEIIGEMGDVSWL